MSTEYVATAGSLLLPKLKVPGLWMFGNASQTPRGHSDETAVIVRKLFSLKADYAFPVTRYNLEIADRFETFAAKWRQETMFFSSPTKINAHSAYREIVDMGSTVVPFILRELQEKPGFWFAALREITGENPVPTKHRGNLKLMADDWLKWGKRKGIQW